MAPAARADPEDVTESGRPRQERPMPDHTSATNCPHCGEEVGIGHYVCWNCSKDVRMGAQTESEILDEYHGFILDHEIALERRNRGFFLLFAGVLLVAAVGNLALGWRTGTSVLFLVLTVVPLLWALKAHRRMGRIMTAQKE